MTYHQQLYIQSPDNPDYCIIDLDNKPSKPLSQEEWQVHERILQAFNTYTEKSASGNGYHIVVKASIPKGRRRGNVEVYSNERCILIRRRSNTCN